MSGRQLPGQHRPAEDGELCTCGRQAVVVYPTHDYGDVGHCGVDGNGAHPVVPCPWCGATRPHATWGVPVRCPDYTLRPPAAEA
ncbi:hypothetical protein [Streptomyces sp. NPDC001492]